MELDHCLTLLRSESARHMAMAKLVSEPALHDSHIAVADALETAISMLKTYEVR